MKALRLLPLILILSLVAPLGCAKHGGGSSNPQSSSEVPPTQDPDSPAEDSLDMI